MCPKTKAVTHMDKILLVVTSYNRPLAFENCLKSLRKMAGHIDVLIIDDHGADGTAVGARQTRLSRRSGCVA